jgi:type I protein arginine methyltransferase
VHIPDNRRIRSRPDSMLSVISGKVEDIVLPDKIVQVDIILSEWMGYGLLYESMLDSVLQARDRFLRPGGIMTPSQCHMVLGLCDALEIHKERIAFWNDIYGRSYWSSCKYNSLIIVLGFDLSVMADEVYDDAIIDVVPPADLLSDPLIIKVMEHFAIPSII